MPQPINTPCVPDLHLVTQQIRSHFPQYRIVPNGARSLFVYRSGRADAPVHIRVQCSRDHLTAGNTVPAVLHPHLRFVGYWKFSRTAFDSAEVDYYVLTQNAPAATGTEILVLPAARLRAILDITTGNERFYWDISRADGRSFASRPLSTSQRQAVLAGNENPDALLDLTPYVNNWQQLVEK